MKFHKQKWKCKKCGFETDSDILYLTHILENHPELTKEEILTTCEFYKTFCNRIKYFLEIHGHELTEEERLDIGQLLADNDFEKFNKWLFAYSFEHLLA
jgi:hypothetical protein